MLVLADLQALASNYASTGVYLSGESLALLLSLNQYCEFHNWLGVALDAELTPTEKDTIQAIVDKAYTELMADNPLIGTVVFAARSTMPNGLLCDGSEYDGADYPQLYAVIDAAFQTADGFFEVPSLIGKFALGTDDEPNAFGGAETHTLTTAQMPAHNHEESGHSHIEVAVTTTLGAIGEIPAPVAVAVPANTSLAFVNLSTVGGCQAHNNMPPYVKLFPFIIYR